MLRMLTSAKLVFVTISCVSLFCLFCVKPKEKWGTITVIEKGDYDAVVLENSVFRIKYDKHSRHDNQVYIVEFIIKGFPENQGDWLDAAAGRRLLQTATIMHDGAEKKTVRLVWNTKERPGEESRTSIEEVTIFPDSPVIQIDYISTCVNIVDIGSPGGIAERNHADLEYIIHGAEAWQKLRKTVTDKDFLEHPNEHHRLSFGLYPQYPIPIIDTPDWHGFAPTPLDYHGWLIMGVYNRKNGRGFGRVVPVEENSYMKLLWKVGFELFPFWFPFWRKSPQPRPFTSYFFAVKNGPEEVIEMGKDIADGKFLSQ
jgi:hypothetical protein